MVRIFAACLIVFALSLTVLADDLTEALRRPGPMAVEMVDQEWRDARRERDVPVRIYYPADADAPCPVIIFSHGLGGSREGYAYLGRRWASHGYVSVHLQHKGSDIDVWKEAERPIEAMREALAQPDSAVHRPMDVKFAIDRLAEINREEGVFKGRLDMDRLGVAGHSFGAYTTMAVAGQVFITARGREISLADPRVKAAIPMSSPVTQKGDQLERAYARINIPCMHMTGTLDDSPIADTTAAQRRIPFDKTPANADQYLIIFIGGDHMIFSGRLRPLPQGKDNLFQELIMVSSTAFWNAYLKSDADALVWLRGNGLDAALEGEATVEKKIAPPRE